jgi:hypothetical protein
VPILPNAVFPILHTLERFSREHVQYFFTDL